MPPLVNWGSVNWQKLKKYVWKLQQRIYRAENLGTKRQVRNLQRLLIRSQAALLLSIKQVTQINKGKRTAGVDGMKALTPLQRVGLFNDLRQRSVGNHKPSPAKRTYIPKKNGKLRPLGIPIIIDRVYQNQLKLALEPQWEARFESTSYGFRPKRSCHDALQNIYLKVCKSDKWIFEGDFKGCFDNLNHDYIMEQVKHFPFARVIKKWLKAGYVDNKAFNETLSGTPQGGIISPLLANIALHGMEGEIGVKYRTINTIRDGQVWEVKRNSHSLVRYADDFVILCRSKEEAETMYDKLEPFLSKRGLELATDKTKVSHITEGFDFLGINVKKYKLPNGKYKTFMKPSKKSIKSAHEKIKSIFEKCKGSNVANLIAKLNPIILGIGNYWKPYVSKKIFSAIDHYIFIKTTKFLKRLHSTKSGKWMAKRYFKPDYSGQSQSKWILTDPDNPKIQIRKMAWIPIERHDLIKFKSTAYDETLKDYFSKRDIKVFNRENVAYRQKLAKKQNYKCPLCGQMIVNGEEGLEIHHKLPKVHGGTETYDNLQLVHISCHIDHHRNFPVRNLPTAGELAKDKNDRKKRRSQNA